jgi:hypothetical protein
MDKKLINEDIKAMKYLFGYKPGRVISEQDIDYTTDDYLDTEDAELDEDIFDGWDDPDNFKSTPLHKHHDLDDDELGLDDLDGFGDEEDDNSDDEIDEEESDF